MFMYHILFSFLWTQALKYLVDPGLPYFELASEERERERERERRERRERGRREGERRRGGEEERGRGS